MPAPLIRAILRIWASVPPTRTTSARMTRLGELMVMTAPDAAGSLSSRRPPRQVAPMARLSGALRGGGAPDAAVSLLRRALQRHPDAAVLHAELGRALHMLAKGEHRRDRYTPSFLTRRDSHLEESARHLQYAHEQNPKDVRIRLELAELEYSAGDAHAALTHIRDLHDTQPSATTAKALAVAFHRSEIADFSAALPAYEEAVSLAPNDKRTIDRLNSVAMRMGSWAGWDALDAYQERRRPDRTRAALLRDFRTYFTDPNAPLDPVRLVSALEEILRDGTPVEQGILQAISARLQHLGYFELGFAVRRMLASKMAATPGNHVPHLPSFTRWAAASACLDRTADILRTFAPYPWEHPSDAVRDGLDAIRADAHLTLGDVTPLVRLGERIDPGANGEERMSRLVRGMRVAIVGPGTPAGAYGREIDEFDVVVRPRFSREFVHAHRITSGSRTDIAYYGGSDTQALKTEARPAVLDGELQLVVARPLSFEALAKLAGGAPWLRFYPRDYALIMNGAPLGITRIAYDILQYEPSELVIYNIDYYTGEQTFADGYRPGRDATAGAGSIVMDIFRAHDLLADFTLHHTLFARGVLRGSPEVTRIAALTPEEYTQALSEAWRHPAAR